MRCNEWKKKKYNIQNIFLSCSPYLTWRDVQHIIVKTSRAGHLSAPDWKTNAAGYNGIDFEILYEGQIFNWCGVLTYQHNAVLLKNIWKELPRKPSTSVTSVMWYNGFITGKCFFFQLSILPCYCKKFTRLWP